MKLEPVEVFYIALGIIALISFLIGVFWAIGEVIYGDDDPDVRKFAGPASIAFFISGGGMLLIFYLDPSFHIKATTAVFGVLAVLGTGALLSLHS